MYPPMEEVEAVPNCRAMTLFAAAAAILLVTAGCSRPAPRGPQGPGTGEQTIRQIGSTTMLPLAEKWRSAFNAKHPGVSIAVSGGGSGTGIRALISKTAEIADSSRDIEPEEVQQAKAAGVTPVSSVVALDGVAVIVNPGNPLKEISMKALSDIYTGRTGDWGAAGAPGLGAIQLVSRDSASGTYEVFKEKAVTLDGTDKSRDYAPQALKQTSNEAVLALVGQTRNAIGYVGLGYVNKSVKVLAIVPMKGGSAVTPDEATVRGETYPIARKLYCVTNGEPMGVVKQYMDWIEGPEGQGIVEQVGFVPAGG